MTFETLVLSKEIDIADNNVCTITNLFINRNMEKNIEEYYSTLQDLSLQDLEKIYAVVCKLINDFTKGE